MRRRWCARRSLPGRTTTSPSPACASATGSAAGSITRHGGTSAKSTAAPGDSTKPGGVGEPLEDRRVLLHAEQGLGDTIQFCRYVTMVASRGGVPILQVQAPVARLMASLPAVRAGLAQVAVRGQTAPDFDLECPLISLPAAFGTTVETVPWSGAYLGAAPEIAAQKLADFPGIGSGLRVGLAWAGNPRYKADAQRSMNLKTLLPLLHTPGVHWIF